MTATFGPWLDRQIKDRGWGITEAARHMDVTHGMVSQWVDGKRNPSARSIRKIAAGLRLDAEVVMEAAGHLSGRDAPSPNSNYAKVIGRVNIIDWEGDPDSTRIIANALDGVIEKQSADEA